MQREELYRRIAELLDVMDSEERYELVDLEYKKEGKHWFLRIFVDKPGGILIDDCEKISRYLGTRLDEMDAIPNSYLLEVSSPGIERPLRKPEDFMRFRGSQVLVKTLEKIGGSRKFQGILEDYRDDQVFLNTDDGTVSIPYNLISQARLKVF